MNLFSMNQIASALGLTKKAVQLELKNIPAQGTIIVRGQKAQGFALSTLPEKMLSRLNAVCRDRGYRTIDHLLSNPPGKWKPKVNGVEVTLKEIHDSQIAHADRLQKALQASLERITSPTYQIEDDITKIGLAEYRAVFNHTPSERHWRRLLDKIIERDAGANCFSRLELYLPERIILKGEVTKDKCGFENTLNRLQELIGVKNPSLDQIDLVWHSALIEMDEKIKSGVPSKEARRELREIFIQSGIHFARTEEALDKTIKRKYARWMQGGCKPSALADKRLENSGNHGAKLSEEDRLKLIAASVERGGRISQAWRQTFQKGALSESIQDRYISNPASKSYVPKTIREGVKNDVMRLEKRHHGPRHAKLNGAFIQRDYSNDCAGDWFQADDTTMNHYYWFVGEDGKRHDMRGQLLLMIDVRTNYILGYCLNNERSYNARIIRNLIVQVHDQYGLPRKGFYFENGIWKSRVIVGRNDDLDFDETEKGLSEFVQFRHAKLPRGKVVERVIGIMQDNTEHLPGYVGRNEMTDKYEEIQRKLQLARTNRLDYESFLLHRDQWVSHLNNVIRLYNEERQEGKLRGQSPKEAYQNHFNYDDPLVQLKVGRYLLSNHRKMMKVGRNGIRLTIGGISHYYKNAETGKAEGEQVMVWYNMDKAPDFITITDANKRNPRVIPRAEAIPAMSATNEQINVATAINNAHQKYSTTLYSIVKPLFSASREMTRYESPDLDTTLTSMEIEKQEEQVTREKKEKITRTKKLQVLAPTVAGDRMNFTKNDSDKLRGIEMIAKHMEVDDE
ncbi:hypothetical protein QQ056_17535 [Oscillatoria laete-virens NRMC-F 0139]|nr:hypothetical protein [Oscillatoria laete-virens]MDL5055337.1 hypothetical protein [Oscillatoria laete-virens NRMC-F 0139]